MVTSILPYIPELRGGISARIMTHCDDNFSNFGYEVITKYKHFVATVMLYLQQPDSTKF